ncbi:MAG: hypothetical protein JWR55_947 [Aeromicrobium sp.]|jgi:hypothetical protein|nr:hypothetical protein [Aeromicrobium sp.]
MEIVIAIVAAIIVANIAAGVALVWRYDWERRRRLARSAGKNSVTR